jgi:hypothetical protein
MERAPKLEPRYVEYALDNLRVKRGATQQNAQAPQPQAV